MSRLDELERRIAELEKHLGLSGPRPQQPVMPTIPTWPLRLTIPTDCGCPVNQACMNVACPRATKITFANDFTAARAS